MGPGEFFDVLLLSTGPLICRVLMYDVHDQQNMAGFSGQRGGGTTLS